MAFAFVSNQTAFLNYMSLKNNNIRRWAITTTIALTISLVISLTLAVIGYIAFGANVKSNILVAFPDNDNVINFARFVLAISMFFTYPMQFYPARTALLRIFGFETAHKESSNKQHISITLVLFLASLGIGLAVTDLGIVYELVGGFCSTMIAYLLPGTAAFVIFSNLRRGSRVWISWRDSANTLIDESEDSEETQTLLGRQQTRVPWTYSAVSIVLVLFGAVSMVAGTGLTLNKLFTGAQ